MRPRFLALPALLAIAYLAAASTAAQSTVQIRPDAAKKQYAVSIGGKPFTTYIYGEEYPDKPFFYPCEPEWGAGQSRVPHGQGRGR